MWIAETSERAIRCESKLNRQIIGKLRLIALLMAALSLRRKSLLNQTTLTDTLENSAIHLLIPVYEI